MQTVIPIHKYTDMIHEKLEEALTVMVKIEAVIEHRGVDGTFKDTREIQDMCRRALRDFTNPKQVAHTLTKIREYRSMTAIKKNTIHKTHNTNHNGNLTSVIFRFSLLVVANRYLFQEWRKIQQEIGTDVKNFFPRKTR